MTKKIQKCYIYTRVSTAIQVDGYSLEAQKDKLRKYAEFQDYSIAGEYSDEGFSGKNIQGRLDFQRMLQDIQDRKDDVDYVLVFKLSRFGRNAADVLNSLQLMQDFGVNLICVEDGIDSSKDALCCLPWRRSSVRTSGPRRWPDVSRRPEKAAGMADLPLTATNWSMVS